MVLAEVGSFLFFFFGEVLGGAKFNQGSLQLIH